MSLQSVTGILDIRTISRGIYEGFNPVVSGMSKLLAALIVAALLLLPDGAAATLDWLKTTTLTHFAGWYVFLLGSIVAGALILVCLPISRRVLIGPDAAIPDHSTPSWLAMMFCSGVGVGILVFSVSEPVSHFLSNPDILGGAVAPGTPEAVTSSLRFVFLHWGLSAWGAYALIGLAIGLTCHRLGQPMTMRSAVAPLFGKKRLEGTLGHTIDVISILAIIAGITTTIVLGLEQICAGLSALSGSPFFTDAGGSAPLTALLTALVVAMGIAIASAISGIDKGIKWTSQAGVLLALAVLGVFIVFGAGRHMPALFYEATTSYLVHLPTELFTRYGESGAEGLWQAEWSIFYWAWWIAFAPFVGLFLARISRGRTVREFILGAMLAPTAMCFVWFTGIGGSALLLELEGAGQGRILAAEHAFRIYAATDVLLDDAAAAAVKAGLIILFLILIVAAATAAIFAIKAIGATGSHHAETPFHTMLWAIIVAAIAGAVMAAGGTGSIRDVMIVGALPFSLIMALMIASIIRMFWSEARAAQKR